MKVLVSGAEKDLGAHIPQIEEVLVPNFAIEARDTPEVCGLENGIYSLSPENYDMWKTACDASDSIDGLRSYCESEYGWTLY